MVDEDDLSVAADSWDPAEDDDDDFLDNEEGNDEEGLDGGLVVWGPAKDDSEFMDEEGFDGAAGAFGVPFAPAVVPCSRLSEQQLGIIELSTEGSESDELGGIEEQIDNAPYIVSPSSSSRRSNRPVASSRMQRKLRSSSGASAGPGGSGGTEVETGLDTISGLLDRADDEMSGLL